MMDYSLYVFGLLTVDDRSRSIVPKACDSLSHSFFGGATVDHLIPSSEPGSDERNRWYLPVEKVEISPRPVAGKHHCITVQCSLSGSFPGAGTG